jgi:4-amino-4-deoxy-L-arabinose transferase-like glycosyltransferase
VVKKAGLRCLLGRPERWCPALIALLALVPRALTAGSFQTVDEVNWMWRSLEFSDAIVNLDPASASAATEDVATMPGVTTMWLGALARLGWWIGGESSPFAGAEAFVHSPVAIHLSQLAVAVATSLLIGLLVALAWRWAGGIVAVTAGVVLATEPFVIAHDSLLHTDELAALFAASGVLALLWAIGLPRRGCTRPRAVAAVAGVLLAGAFLSKLSALALAPGLALIVLALALVATPVRPVLSLLGITAGAATVTVVIAWPAIWADTANQLGLIRESAGLAEMGHLTFFRGDPTETPGPLFYAVATPLRMTPWFLVGSILLAPLALARSWRRHAVLLLVVALPAVVALSVASKQFDRYILIVLPYLALMVGMGLDVSVTALRRARADAVAATRPLIASGALIAAALFTHAVAVAPWGLAYFNPLLGGSATAERTLLVGWGEGLELAGERIREREAPQCDVDVAVFEAPGYAQIRSAFPCGRPTADFSGADYLILYVNRRQRVSDAELENLRSAGSLVDVIRIRGIDYVEVYDSRDR